MAVPSALYFVGVGVAGAAAGFFVGWKLRGRKASKELDKILAYQKHQMDILDKKFKELKGSINANLNEKKETWEKIAKGSDSTEEEEAPEKPKTERLEKELMYRRPEDKRANYNAITSGLDYAEPEDRPSDAIIRWEADNGIYEVQQREYEESKEFIDEEMEFYDASGDVYKDDVLIEPDEVPLYLGYSRDELAARFLHDEPECIYIRNAEYERYYIVYWKEGLMPQ